MTDLVEQVVARAVRSNALARSGSSKEERMVHAKEAARLAMMAAGEFQKLSGAQRRSLTPSVSLLLGGGDAKEIFHNLLRPMSSETMARRFPFPSASDIALQKVLAGALQQQQPAARNSEECKTSLREAEVCKASLREAEANLASARQRAGESRAQQQVAVPAGMLERTRAAIRRYQSTIRNLENDLSRSTSLINILQQNLQSSDGGGACLVERVEGESSEQVRASLEAQYPDSDITVVEAGDSVMSGGGGARSFLVSVRPRTQKGAANTIYVLQKSLAALRKLESKATTSIAARDADRREKMSADLEGTRNRLQQATTELERTKSKLAQATTDHENTKNRLQRATSDLTEARENASSATQETERLEKGLEEMRVTRTTADETCRERIQGMTSQLEAKASELEAKASDLASRTSELESANKVAEDARGEVERVAQRVAELERATEEKTQNIQELERAVSNKAHELESTRSAAQAAVQACENDKSEAARRLAAATRDLRALRNDIATRDARITELTEQLNRSQDALAGVTRERDAYVVDLERRLESIRNCETSLDACRASHARRSSEEKRESRETSEAHHAEREALAQKNRDLARQKAALMQQLAETEATLAQEIDGRATDRREFETAVQACGADKASAQELAERLKEASSASIQQLRDLATRLGVQGAAGMSVGDVVSKLENYRNPEELRSCQRKAEDAQRKLDETRLRCEAETQLNAQLVELGTELFQCSGDPVACLRSNVQNILEAARTAEERAQEWQATVSRQREAIADTRQRLESAERKAAEAERDESNARKDADLEKKRADDLQKQRDRLRDSVTSLQTELQSLRTNEAAAKREAEASKAQLVVVRRDLEAAFGRLRADLRDEKELARDARETSEKATLDLAEKTRETETCVAEKKDMELQEVKLRNDMRKLEEAKSSRDRTISDLETKVADRDHEINTSKRKYANIIQQQEIMANTISNKETELKQFRESQASAVESAVDSAVDSAVTNMRREIEAGFQEQTTAKNLEITNLRKEKDSELGALRLKKDRECRTKVRKEASDWQKINRTLTQNADVEKAGLTRQLTEARDLTAARDKEIARLYREANIIARWSDPTTKLEYYGIPEYFNDISFNSQGKIKRKINKIKDSMEERRQFWSWFSDASTASKSLLDGALGLLSEISALAPMVPEIKYILGQIDAPSYESVQSNWRQIRKVFKKYGDMYINGTLPTEANEEEHRPPDLLPEIAWSDTASWVR